MPSDLANLKTTRSNYLAELARESGSPKPSYNIDGQDVKWSEYRTSLEASIANLGEMIAREEPYEIVSRGTH